MPFGARFGKFDVRYFQVRYNVRPTGPSPPIQNEGKIAEFFHYVGSTSLFRLLPREYICVNKHLESPLGDLVWDETPKVSFHKAYWM